MQHFGLKHVRIRLIEFFSRTKQKATEAYIMSIFKALNGNGITIERIPITPEDMKEAVKKVVKTTSS